MNVDSFNSNPYINIFQTIGSLADKKNIPCYIVGGFVRDILLNKSCKDIDIMVVGDPIDFSLQIKNIVDVSGYVVFEKYRMTHFQINTSPTEHLSFEIVGARKESYHSKSRNPITEIGTLEDDLSRRDFTMNALAISLNKKTFGHLTDFFQGKKDLENKILRTPLDADVTFSDDPLRMMRAARFASQLEIDFTPEILHAIRKNAERIKIISQERITDEILKILNSNKPSIGFRILYDTGLLKIIFPELQNLHGVEQVDGKGHKDVLFHTLEVVDNISLKTTNQWLRMAALLHDIAKPKTKRFKQGIGWTFHGHDAVGAKMVLFIFQNLRLPFEPIPYIQKLVRLHLRPIPLSRDEISDSAIRRLMVEAGEDLNDLMILCRSDITSKNPNKVKRVLDNFNRVEEKIANVEEKDVWAKWRPPINGSEIMEMFSLPACKEIGILKTALENAILDGEIPFDKEASKQFLIKKYQSLHTKLS